MRPNFYFGPHNYRMNFLDLFSGIGGFALGAKWAGWEFENHLYSEIEPYAVAVYEKNFPDAVNLGDVRTINGQDIKEKYGGDWLLAGGFPCQDISEGGKQRGIYANRSGLWFQMQRLISEIRPRYVLIENVFALSYRGLDRVLLGLAACGYDAEWQCISAAHIGAPHNRRRLWIVAYPSGARGGQPDQVPAVPLVANVGEIDLPKYTDEGLPSWSEWQRVIAERNLGGHPLACRVDDGVSDQLHRLKALGNAIVPEIAYLIFNRLKELEISGG